MSDTLRVLYDRKNEVFRLRLCSVGPVKNNTFKTVEECIRYLEGHTTLTEDDLKLFDGSDGQGIRCNKNSPIIILISGHRDYTDDDDGEILKYQGMKNNNSQNRSKNKQIVDTLDDHRPLCVLESFMDRDGKKMYAYKGQYILIEEPKDWPDAENIVFHLKKVPDSRQQVNETKDFIDILRQDGYFFDIELIERFLLSIKAKKFVIFSGNSGNGKTALAMEYG